MRPLNAESGSAELKPQSAQWRVADTMDLQHRESQHLDARRQSQGDHSAETRRIPGAEGASSAPWLWSEHRCKSPTVNAKVTVCHFCISNNKPVKFVTQL